MNALFAPVERALKQQQRWVSAPTLMQVNEMWTHGSKVIALEDQTQRKRKRRTNQCAWTTQLNEYRKRARGNTGHEDSSNNEDDEE